MSKRKNRNKRLSNPVVLPYNQRVGSYAVAFVYPRKGTPVVYKGPVSRIVRILMDWYSTSPAWVEFLIYRGGTYKKEWMLYDGSNDSVSLVFRRETLILTGRPNARFRNYQSLFYGADRVKSFRKIPRKWIKELDQFLTDEVRDRSDQTIVETTSGHPFQSKEDRGKQLDLNGNFITKKLGDSKIVLIDDLLNRYLPDAENIEDLEDALSRLQKFEVKAEQDERREKFDAGMQLVPSQDFMNDQDMAEALAQTNEL